MVTVFKEFIIKIDKKESKCGSVRTLLGLIPELSDNETTIVFRGHADKSYDIKPSIYRKNEWHSNEDKIVREILMRCPADFSHMQTNFEKLVKMQHYDLPTRLLDITQNPLVALYFACVGADEKEKDGEIVFFKIPKNEIKYFDSDTVSVISGLAWAKDDFEIEPKHERDDKAFHRSNDHALKLMHIIKQEKPYFLEKINPMHLQSVVCVKPKLDNPRVIRQEGSFLLFGIDRNKHQIPTIPDEWLYYPKERRVIIKSTDKEQILKQLATIGISRDKLFPEIDMVSQFIKNEYGLDKNEFISNHSKRISSQLKGPIFMSR
jgi:hypothetical protein